MKIRNLLPLIIIPVALVGCNNKNNKGSKDRTEPNKVTLEMSGIANTAKSEPYSIEFE